jgi:hypothetical protein
MPNPGIPVDHIYGCNCKQLPTHVTVSEVIFKNSIPRGASSFVDSKSIYHQEEYSEHMPQ